MAKWKIGKVMSVNIPGADDPYGFTVFKEGGERLSFLSTQHRRPARAPPNTLG
jgi:hypothetical protein